MRSGTVPSPWQEIPPWCLSMGYSSSRPCYTQSIFTRVDSWNIIIMFNMNETEKQHNPCHFIPSFTFPFIFYSNELIFLTLLVQTERREWLWDILFYLDRPATQYCSLQHWKLIPIATTSPCLRLMSLSLDGKATLALFSAEDDGKEFSA